MKTPLRVQFMTWLTVQTLIVFVLLAGILFAFNLHEQSDHPDLAAEEMEEMWMMLGLMALTLPALLGAAWWISKRQLAPLRHVLDAAEAVRSGRLDQPIEVPVKTDEIGQLAGAINDAFARYQHALRRLDRFSGEVAHQLRNPLAAIRTTAEVTLEQPRRAEDYQDALARIVEDVRRLGHAVDQLLTLARLDRSRLRDAEERFDLAALVRDIVAIHQPAFEERAIRCALDLSSAPVHLTGLPRLLEQAIANLLDNAARFTPDHGQIAIALRNDTGHVTLSVADSGVGLPAQMRAKPVDQFSQLGDRLKSGTGLGLIIAADVVRLHHGQLTAAASALGGAEFIINLPAPQP
jgi:signal transduction histidine kinase